MRRYQTYLRLRLNGKKLEPTAPSRLRLWTMPRLCRLCCSRRTTASRSDPPVQMPLRASFSEGSSSMLARKKADCCE